jgi:hypothetical protein
MEDQRKLAPSFSLHSQVIAGHDHSSNKCSVFLNSRLGATVMSNHLTLQPPNPDRAREQTMRTGPIARLSGVQVAEGKVRHDSRQDRRRPHFMPHYSGPPHSPLKAEWQGGSRIHLSVVDHDGLILTVRELRIQFQTPPPIKGRMERGIRNASLAIDLGGWILSIQICLLLTLMRIRAPA